MRTTLITAMCMIAVSACSKEKASPASRATLDYGTSHFQLSLPGTIENAHASVRARVWEDDNTMYLTYWIPDSEAFDLSIDINISRTPLKGNKDIAIWREHIPNERPAKITQGIEGTVFISDLHDFPIEGTRSCSLGYTYAFPVLKSLYVISFSSVQRDVPLDTEEVWKKECTLLSDAEHEKFIRFMNTVMDSFQLNEPPLGN